MKPSLLRGSDLTRSAPPCACARTVCHGGADTIRRSLLLLVLVAWPLVATPADLPTRTLSVRDQKFVVEVASTPEARSKGLMNRFSLPQDRGMLFVFEAPQPLAFWMKNTYVPLSIAFVDARGRIINIEHMRPLDEATYWSRGAALYAIEMRQGWFAAKGIAAGDVVEGLP